MSWEDTYDAWKLNPPEAPDIKFACEGCQEPFFPGDGYYEIEGQILCTACAEEWLRKNEKYVTHEQCYGED